MTDFFNPFYSKIAQNRLAPWLEMLPKQLNDWYKHSLHGEFKDWIKNVNLLPDVAASDVNLQTLVSVGDESTLSEGLRKKTKHHLYLAGICP